MIKKFTLLLENNNFGQWVESIYSDEMVKNFVNQFLADSPSDIDLVNALNLLDSDKQNELKMLITNYQQKGISDVEVAPISNVEGVEKVEAGKGVFTSFLKSITALGSELEKKAMKEYLFFYRANASMQDLEQIFARFKSLSMYQIGKETKYVYFGIRLDGSVEYGLDTQKLGRFDLKTKSLNMLKDMTLKSVQGLKKDIADLSMNDILTLGKIKSSITDLSGSLFSVPKNIDIKDRVITITYYGIGRWDNGTLDGEDFNDYEAKLIKYINSNRWKHKVLMNVNAKNFYVNFCLKLK